MFKLNDDNKVVKTVDVEYGDAVETAQKVQFIQQEISKLKAALERAMKQVETKVPAMERDIAELIKFGKMANLPEVLTDEQKIILVSTGIRTPEDFPGDDWTVPYAPK